MIEDDLVDHDPGFTKPTKITEAGPWLLGVGGVAVLAVFATAMAVRDDARGVLSLEWLTPLMSIGDEIGWWFLRHPLQSVLRGGFLVAAPRSTDPIPVRICTT